MKILFISEYFPPIIKGGGEINLFLLAKALVKQKIDVNILTSHHPNLKKYEKVDEIKIYRKLNTGDSPSEIISNLKRSITFPKSIIKEVRKLDQKENFDLIHFIGTSLIVARKLRQILKISPSKKPFFATIESYPSLCPKGNRIYQDGKECKYICSFSKFIKCQQKSSEIGKMKNRWFLKYNPFFLTYLYWYHKKLKNSLKYCRLIAISEYLQKVLLQHHLRSTTIPNALEGSKFQIKNNPEIRSKKDGKNKKNRKTRIVYLGSLTKFKGPQVLLRALKGLDCHCDFFGEGNLKDKLKQVIKKHKLNAEIHSPVPYNQIPKIYANADIVVFPSIWPEPFGRIAIEAMAAGKPVIGSNIGGIGETINKGTGLLFQPNNHFELRQKIQELIKDKKKYGLLSKKGLLSASKYEEKIVINKLIKEYQRFKLSV